MKNRKAGVIGIFIAMTLVISIVTGCSKEQGNGSLFGDASSKQGEAVSAEDIGFTFPRVANASDFDWYFKSGKILMYTKSDIKDPLSITGVWEVCIWRKPKRDAQYQKEIYWINIDVDASELEVKDDIMGVEGMDDADIAEIYGSEAAKDSEWAQNSGIETSDTTERLMEALHEFNTPLMGPATATMVQVGLEDADGNYKAIENAKPIKFEGTYAPNYTLLKLESEDGMKLESNVFVDVDGSQRCVATYTSENEKKIPNGMVYMCR